MPARFPRRHLLAGAVAGIAPGRAPGDELAVIVHPGLRVRTLTAPQLELIFLCAHQTWPEGTGVVPVSYTAGHPLRTRFDLAVLGLSPEAAQRHWEGQRTGGGLRPARALPTPELARRLIAKLPGSIGYVPAALVDGRTRVVARLRGGVVVGP